MKQEIYHIFDQDEMERRLNQGETATSDIKFIDEQL
jgi:hypothetical protein